MSQGNVATVEKMPPPAEMPRTETTSMLQAIERLAMNPDLDLDRFERLIQMQERLQSREAARQFDDAMATMQPELPIIDEKGQIEKRSSYAKWDDINEAIKPVLARHGFGLTFRNRQTEGRIFVTAVLSHRAGHREETEIELGADASGGKNNVQAVGSSLSYGQRYTAKLLLNLTSRKSADDDGRAAGKATVSPDQVERLRKALAFRDVPEERALKRFKVESFDQIYAVDFDACLRIAENAGGAREQR